MIQGARTLAHTLQGWLFDSGIIEFIFGGVFRSTEMRICCKNIVHEVSVVTLKSHRVVLRKLRGPLDFAVTLKRGLRVLV